MSLAISSEMAAQVFHARRSADRLGRFIRYSLLGLGLSGVLLYRGGPVDRVFDIRHRADTVVMAVNGQLFARTDDPTYRRVAVALQDWDLHAGQRISVRAEAFRAQSAAGFISNEQTGEARNAIAAAADGEEVLAALEPVLQFYGKQAVLVGPADARMGEVAYAEQDLNNLKRYAERMLNVLERLPRQLVANRMRFADIRFAGNLEPGAGGLSTTNGYYDGRSITFNLHGSVMLISDEEQVVAHELAHSLVQHSGAHDERTPGLFDTVGYLVSSYWGSPVAGSLYGTTNEDENTAENVASVLRGRLIHPDQTRRFESPANRDRLETLLYLERAFPGITDYLINLTKGR